MKYFYTILFLFIFSSAVFSQASLKLYDENDNEISNTTEALVAGQNYHFKIENTSGNPVDLNIVITDISVPDGATGVEVCAFGYCYIPATSTGQLNTSAYTLDAGETYYASGDHIIYRANGAEGDAMVTVSFQEDGNPDNSVSYTLDTSVAFAKEITERGVKLYPNPASNFVQVSDAAQKDAESIELYNINGQMLMKQKLNESKISVEKLKPGLYFYHIYNSSNALIASEKLLIEK